MYKRYNPNPNRIITGDCTIRACVAVGIYPDWYSAFDDLSRRSREQCRLLDDMTFLRPYLSSIGKWHGMRPEKGVRRMTVSEFSDEYFIGRYILRCSHHLLGVVDGNYMDTWDSGDLSIYGYWEFDTLGGNR